MLYLLVMHPIFESPAARQRIKDNSCIVKLKTLSERSGAQPNLAMPSQAISGSGRGHATQQNLSLVNTTSRPQGNTNAEHLDSSLCSSHRSEAAPQNTWSWLCYSRRSRSSYNCSASLWVSIVSCKSKPNCFYPISSQMDLAISAKVLADWLAK